MNEIKEIEQIKIVDMIYEIRGKQVMIVREQSRIKRHNCFCDTMKYTMILLTRC